MRDRQMLMDEVETYRRDRDGTGRQCRADRAGRGRGRRRDRRRGRSGADARWQEFAAAKELEALLDGEADGNDTFLEINAGAGGTESCDWASMLARMYVRWAEKKGYKVELQSENAGEEAGIKSAAYKISGPNAYGWLKSESGVHRLVRISAL